MVAIIITAMTIITKLVTIVTMTITDIMIAAIIRSVVLVTKYMMTMVFVGSHFLKVLRFFAPYQFKHIPLT
jgi:hypothetical protein